MARGPEPGRSGREERAIADHRGQRFALKLHFGTGKTGTTSLQVFLRRNLVARELLGQPYGVQFTAPPRTHNTTTQQWLNPARGDDYLAALPQLPQLPKKVATPLRSLAEREAQPKCST